MLETPWYARVPVVANLFRDGAVLRYLHQAEQHLSANRLYKAKCAFRNAYRKAESANLSGLQVESLCGLARVLLTQEWPEQAEQTLEQASTITERLPEDNPLVEHVASELERLRENRMVARVGSRLRNAHLRAVLTEALTGEAGEEASHEASLQSYDEVAVEVCQTLGYRHWLHAVVLYAKACETSDYSSSPELIRNAWYIALEYPEKAADLLEAIKNDHPEIAGS